MNTILDTTHRIGKPVLVSEFEQSFKNPVIFFNAGNSEGVKLYAQEYHIRSDSKVIMDEIRKIRYQLVVNEGALSFRGGDIY